MESVSDDEFLWRQNQKGSHHQVVYARHFKCNNYEYFPFSSISLLDLKGILEILSWIKLSPSCLNESLLPCVCPSKMSFLSLNT